MSAAMVCGPVRAQADAKTQQPWPVEVSVEDAQGSAGRLVIPDLTISVPLYDISAWDTGDAQAQVDQENSAVVINQIENSMPDGQDFIGDHKNQDHFSRIGDAVPNKTEAYIVRGDQVTAYRCTARYEGHNWGTEYLYDMDGNPVNERNQGGFLTYTCLENWEHIVIAEWSPEVSSLSGAS